jgi:hypothetical protein
MKLVLVNHAHVWTFFADCFVLLWLAAVLTQGVPKRAHVLDVPLLQPVTAIQTVNVDPSAVTITVKMENYKALDRIWTDVNKLLKEIDDNKQVEVHEGNDTSAPLLHTLELAIASKSMHYVRILDSAEKQEVK